MTPTAIESQLPWKRVEEDGEGGVLKQNEFPAWASNKEYLAYNSPSATFLGNIAFDLRNKQKKQKKRYHYPVHITNHDGGENHIPPVKNQISLLFIIISLLCHFEWAH